MKSKLLILPAALLTSLLAGCMGGPGDAGSTTKESVVSIGVADALAIATEPAYVGNPATQALNAEIYQQLVGYKDGEALPELAKSWQNSDTAWTFELDDATFSDGTSVKSEDVKASIERIADPDLGAATGALWKGVLDSIDTPDEKTVVINTVTPIGTILANLSVLNISPAVQLRPIQKELQLELGTAKLPIGSGPYILESHSSEREAVLIANKNFWGQKPSVQRLEYKYIPELTARYTALETGDIDFTWGVPPDQLTRLKGLDSITVESLPANSIYVMYMNGSRKPFIDPKVRVAMRMAVDMDQLATDLFPDYGEVATAALPSGVFGYEKQTPYPFDPERAKSMLADAGLPNGFSADLQYVSGSAPQLDQLVQGMIAYWAKIGVKVKPVPMEAAAWGADLKAVNFDMSINTSGTPTGDADYTLSRLYSANAPAADVPYSGVRNPELDAAISDAQTSQDRDVRKKAYATAMGIMWDQAIAFWPIQPPVVYAWRTDRISGVTLPPVPTPLFEKAKLEG